MPFGMDYMEVRVGPDHIVLDGNPAPHKRHSSPINFDRCLLWPNGSMDQNVTWYGGRPQRRRHCVRWHVQIGKRFEPSAVLWAFHTIQPSSYISRESYTMQNVWSRASVCLCVCLSVAVFPQYCMDPDVTWRNGRGCPLVVHYWADLQSLHVSRCYDNIARTRNVSQCLYYI